MLNKIVLLLILFVLWVMVAGCSGDSPEGIRMTANAINGYVEVPTPDGDYVSTSANNEVTTPNIEVIKINSAYRLIDNELGVVCYFRSRSAESMSCLAIPEKTGR